MNKNSILLLGPAGTGKTYYAKQIAHGHKSLLIFLNNNSSYENLINGIEIITSGGTILYEERKKAILNFLLEAKANNSEEYYLILDDINRVDLNDILGEVIYALKNRGSIISLKNEDELQIFDNLKVIATASTSDTHSETLKKVVHYFDKIEYVQNDLDKYLLSLKEMKNKCLCPFGPLEYNELEKSLSEEYIKYTSKYCVFNKEYKKMEREYKIGYTYFLPPSGIPMKLWFESVQHKIRNQVRPLLFKLSEDGIIKKEYIPKEYVNDTRYIFGSIKEEQIIILNNSDILDEEINVFDNGHHLPIGQDAGGHHTSNWQYLILICIVRDMINNSLINHLDLFDIFLNDYDVLCYSTGQKTPSGKSISGLFLEENYVQYFCSNDNANGNKGSYTYRANLHKFLFNNKTYLMFNAYNADRLKVLCPYTIKDCIRPILRAQNGQKRHLYQTIKVLVYKYLSKYKKNLEQILEQEEILECRILFNQVINDLDFVSKLTDDDKYADKPYYIQLHGQNGRNIIDTIRNLPTWLYMKNNNGVYKIMSNEYKKIMNITKIKQMILQGPPGTSKTYSAKKFICDEIGITGDDWEKQIENYHLVTNNNEYKEPLTGKKTYWDIIQFHPSYTYEDFVRGIAVFPNQKPIYGEIKGENEYSIKMNPVNSIEYKSINKTIGKIAKLSLNAYKKAERENKLDECPNYYLIIDEINRANLATVFGKLIYALEYRGEEGKIKTPYVVDGTDSLVLPPNLYIIGTMNTADKSIGIIDYAIRRRFLFFKLLPNVNTIVNSINKKSPEADIKCCIEIQLFYVINVLFENCLNTFDYEKEDVQLGHTYFLRKSSDTKEIADQAMYRFLYQVVPIIFEYKKDGILDLGKIKSMNNSVEKEILKILSEILNANENKKIDKYKKMVTILVSPDAQSLIEKYLNDNKE